MSKKEFKSIHIFSTVKSNIEHIILNTQTYLNVKQQFNKTINFKTLYSLNNKDIDLLKFNHE